SQWTNSAFGGMPSYQIKTGKSNNIFYYLFRVFKLFLPGYSAAPLFLYLLGFYILLITLKLNRWLALAGAIAFAFSSYHIIILPAGHVNKTYAIAYMAPIIAGIILTFRKRYVLGGILTTIALGLEITSNHFQITYYLGMMILIYLIFQFFYEYKKKELNHFFKSCAILFIALILAVLPNLTGLWTTYEYSKETTRGKSELITDEENQTSGLDKDYATGWSYGVAETMNLFIPNFRGGSSGGELSKKSNFYDDLRKNNVQNPDQYIKQVPLYWGAQPGTSGPNYIGAVSIFVFILGLFLFKGRFKWWLLSSTILAILLAWGKNFMPFSSFFFDYFPGYNKWRVVSTTLIIANFAIPLLALLTLKKIFEEKFDKELILKTLKNTFYVVGGIALLFALFPGMGGDFIGRESNGFENFSDSLQLDRRHLLSVDAFRSFVFVSLTAGLLFAFLKGYIKKQYIYFGFIFLFLADMWMVDRRFLNEEKFVNRRSVNKISASPANLEILKDKDPNYRVMSINNPFNNGTTSYFHKAIGGYHGAKLGRYQELIDDYLYNSYVNIFNLFAPGNASYIRLDSLLSNQKALNMLNTRYLIIRPNMPVRNQHALGNVWFVNNYQIVDNANDELAGISNIDPGKTAVIDKRFSAQLENIPVSTEDSLSNGQISLTLYRPNHLTYKSSSKTDRLAVFSEIYYSKGWNAYIDNNKVDHLRANYVLRALSIPAGDHTIEFKFEPRSYAIGQAVSLIFSILVFLLIIGTIVYSFIGKKNIKTEIDQ
ncbi:YfhO family protein, partial [Bacteroidota bacterium]